jgi:uncharacterized protein YggE
MRSIVILFFLLLNVSVFAQETFKGEHFIEVTGTAQMEVDPNELYLFIRLREFEENRNKVQLEKLDQDFLAALKAAGIDKKNLALANAGSQLGKLGRKDKDAFREKSYEMKLSSAADLEKFLEKLEPVKVETLTLTKVTHSDLEKFKIDLKIKALQAAQTKAQSLLKAIGSEIGKPLMVRDWETEPVQPMYDQGLANVRFKSAAADMAGEMPADDQVGFRKIKLRAQINAQFEIK